MSTAVKHVAITGVSSFVGHAVATRFVRRGLMVTGITSRPVQDYTGVQRQRLQLQTSIGVNHVEMDIRTQSEVLATVQRVRADAWIHHAGWAKDHASLEFDLERGHASNLMPLATFFRALSEVTCSGLIVTGTSAEYSDGDAPHQEDEPCHPTLPYGLSKLTATLRAGQLAATFGVRARVARLFMPFGPLDAPAKLLPQVVSTLRAGKPIELTECTHVRDFLYIDDVASFYERLVGDLQRPVLFDVFNVSRGQGHRVRDVLLQLAAVIGADPSLLRFGARPLRPGDPQVLVGSATKGQTLLKWSPSTLADGIRDYVSTDCLADPS